jgi:catalase
VRCPYAVRQCSRGHSILDATKIWPENLVPLQEVGELVLKRTVDEFFPEVEQVGGGGGCGVRV